MVAEEEESVDTHSAGGSMGGGSDGSSSRDGGEAVQARVEETEVVGVTDDDDATEELVTKTPLPKKERQTPGVIKCVPANDDALKEDHTRLAERLRVYGLKEKASSPAPSHHQLACPCP